MLLLTLSSCEFTGTGSTCLGAHRGASIIAEQLSGNSSIHFKGYLGNNIVKFLTIH